MMYLPRVFKERFTTKHYYDEFLAELKWSSGYYCKQYDSNISIKSKQSASRGCSKCGVDETTTAGTLFHTLEMECNING